MPQKPETKGRDRVITYSEYETAMREGKQMDLPIGPYCLRMRQPFHWNHYGWRKDARTLAVLCLQHDPQCKDCHALLRAEMRRHG